MVRAEQDIPNLILDEFGRFTLKSTRTFFSWIQEFPVVGVNLFGLHIFHLRKLLSFGNFFMGGCLQTSIFKIKVCIFFSMCTLCEKHEESHQHLFFESSNALRIWSWVRRIFPTSHFSNKDDLLSFIKSDGTPLVKLIKFVVITFSIWMIWRMRNYARFQDNIEVSRAISVIKDLTRLVGNSSKASMKNDMLDFNVIKFFGINTHTCKVLRPLPVRWEFPSPDWVKINTNGVVRGYLGLATCGGNFHGRMGEFIGAFSKFLEV